MKKGSLTFALAFLFWAASAQTNPTAQTLPVSQNFGTSTFTTLPAGMATWGGLSGGTIITQALAEASAPTADATVTAITTAASSEGTYGYSSASNGKLYIEMGGGTAGVNQIAFAINTGPYHGVFFSYTMEMLDNTGGRNFGTVLQYRQGTSGSWTTVAGSAMEYTTSSTLDGDGDAVGDVDDYSFSITGLTANTVYQFRFAHWRTGTGANDLGMAYDNITIQGTYALPVQLSRLTVTEKGNGRQLNFSNLTEAGIDFYEIEHATDGIHFSPVGRLRARNNNGEQAEYNFTDATMGSLLHFYRIRAVEAGGRSSYSAVVKISSMRSSGLAISPNPIEAGNLQFQVAALPAGPYQVQVIGPSGQVVWQENWQHNGGTAARSLSLSLAPGTYIMAVGTQKERFVVR